VAVVYNPIVRVFGQLRAALAEATGVPSRAIRPWTELEWVLPLNRRRELWRAMQRQGLRLPALELPHRAGWLGCLVLTIPKVASVFLLGWCLGSLAAVVAVALLVLLSRPWVREFPAGLRTVGDLTLYITDDAEHRASGYKWTRNEIAFKVRVVLAESLNIPLDQIDMKSRLNRDLGAT
jgi:hypothetical protein